MNRKIIVSVFACATIAVLVIVGYFFNGGGKKAELSPSPVSSENKNATENITAIGDQSDQLNESIAKGTLPSIQTNVLEEKPDLNPVEKTNPYTDIKTNPFK